MVRAVLTGQSTGSAFDLAWFGSLSSEHLCIFGLHGAICIFKRVLCNVLCFAFWWDESGRIGCWPSWLANVLQCHDTVDWVIWPVKSSPVICRLGRWHTWPSHQLKQHWSSSYVTLAVISVILLYLLAFWV